MILSELVQAKHTNLKCPQQRRNTSQRGSDLLKQCKIRTLQMARDYSEDRQQQPDKTNHHDTLFHLYLILTKDKIWKVAERTRRCCNAGSNHQWLTLARVCLFALFSFSRRAGGAWFCLLRGVSVYYCHIVFTSQYKTLWGNCCCRLALCKYNWIQLKWIWDQSLLKGDLISSPLFVRVYKTKLFVHI